MQPARVSIIPAAVAALLLQAAAGFGAAAPPKWLQDHLGGEFRLPGAYHGISFADFKGSAPDYDAMRLAKDRALDELCYQLSVSVKSDFESRARKQGRFEEEQITSSLLVTSRKVLSGVVEKDRHTDARSRRHWVLLVIDQNQADRQLEEQKFVDQVLDRLEHRQDDILEGIDRIAQVLDRHMAAYREQMDHYGQLLQAIDEKIGAGSDRTGREYAQIRETIQRLEERQDALEQERARRTERQQEQLAQLMRQNAQLQALLLQLAGKVRQDYFLALTSDDLKHSGRNPGFSVSIRPERGQGAVYRRGEQIRFLVSATGAAYLKVIYLSSIDAATGSQKKINTLLFPNPHDRDNWIPAGGSRVVGRYDELEVQAPFGQDVVTVVASPTQFADLAETLAAGAGGFYSEVTSDTRGAIEMRTRGIGVVPAAGKSSQAGPVEAAVASDTCLIVSRP